MKSALLRPAALLMSVLMTVQPVLATCGGGGGGGRGGISGGNDGTQSYKVPWRFLAPDSPRPTEGLVIYWFPASQNEVDKSSLRVSRQLSTYASQCVSLEVANMASEPGQKFVKEQSQLPVAVIATPDNTQLQRLDNKDGKLKVEDLEKLLENEMKTREKSLDDRINQAKEKSKSGDNNGAIATLKEVYAQKCMFPKKAKDAAKELKKLGVNDVADIRVFPTPSHDAALSRKIDALMTAGLIAEEKADYTAARDNYIAAGKLDPADPTPLRYLGETYRHHLGQWDLARVTFNQILAMPADPMSRAVALHGLGKMTIHEGDFKKGLHLMEQSVKEYPLALAYRNLAVYWNSEGDQKKAAAYTDLALKLDPKDPFNLIFAAAFKAGNADPKVQNAALAIAKAHESELPASYNLAAIYAQAGQREKALTLLKRHFFEYERYQEVRTKEMMEARVDAVFATLRADREFLALTRDADGRLPMPMSPKAAAEMKSGGGSQ